MPIPNDPTPGDDRSFPGRLPESALRVPAVDVSAILSLAEACLLVGPQNDPRKAANLLSQHADEFRNKGLLTLPERAVFEQLFGAALEQSQDYQGAQAHYEQALATLRDSGATVDLLRPLQIGAIRVALDRQDLSLATSLTQSLFGEIALHPLTEPCGRAVFIAVNEIIRLNRSAEGSSAAPQQFGEEEIRTLLADYPDYFSASERAKAKLTLTQFYPRKDPNRRDLFSEIVCMEEDPTDPTLCLLRAAASYALAEALFDDPLRSADIPTLLDTATTLIQTAPHVPQLYFPIQIELLRARYQLSQNDPREALAIFERIGRILEENTIPARIELDIYDCIAGDHRCFGAWQEKYGLTWLERSFALAKDVCGSESDSADAWFIRMVALLIEQSPFLATTRLRERAKNSAIPACSRIWCFLELASLAEDIEQKAEAFADAEACLAELPAEIQPGARIDYLLERSKLEEALSVLTSPEQLLREALTLARTLSDSRYLVRCRTALLSLFSKAGRLDEAKPIANELEASLREDGEKLPAGVALETVVRLLDYYHRTNPKHTEPLLTLYNTHGVALLNRASQNEKISHGGIVAIFRAWIAVQSPEPLSPSDLAAHTFWVDQLLDEVALPLEKEHHDLLRETLTYAIDLCHRFNADMSRAQHYQTVLEGLS